MGKVIVPLATGVGMSIGIIAAIWTMDWISELRRERGNSSRCFKV